MTKPREELDDSLFSLTPEDIVNDYLIGEHELEKLRNGFQAPVEHAPCDEHRPLGPQAGLRDS